MKQNETNFPPKISKLFYCNDCSIRCSKESDFIRHLSTRKHEMKQNETKMKQNETCFSPKNAIQNKVSMMPVYDQNIQNKVSKTKKNGGNSTKNAVNTMYECEKCGLELKSRTTLWRHRKICLTNQYKHTATTHSGAPTHMIESSSNYVSSTDFKEIIMLMMKDNNEFQKSFMDILPHIQCGVSNSHNNINTNSNNTNNFNIQMFLNEHCKNAMNLTDFIDSLPITSDTYDSTIENGLTKTITNMLVNGLSQLDILDRPIHCTDATRKTLYVKDHNTWERDNELLLVLKGIKTLSMKQRTMLNKWQDANRGWDTKDNLQSRMTRLIYNSMTSIENDDKETSKIIRAISKNVYLDTDTKNQYNQLV